jgi:hypothetical protein
LNTGVTPRASRRAPHGSSGATREFPDTFIRQPQPLREPKLVGLDLLERSPDEVARALDHLCDLIDEPGVDPRGGCDGVDRLARCEQRSDQVQSVLGGPADAGQRRIARCGEGAEICAPPRSV